MTNPCPICRILDAAQEQRLEVATILFNAACHVHCACAGVNHQPLVVHPHSRPGCRGFASRPHHPEPAAARST
jgi:hypothetical protein